MNLIALTNTAKEGATKKKKRPTHHKPQKRVPFQTHKNKKNKTCENCDPMTLECVVHSKYTTAEGVATERDRREYLLASIVVTAPVFHLDTSELNADASRNTAREGATKNNKTCEKCDPMKLELSYIQKTQRRKARPQREGERVHLL